MFPFDRAADSLIQNSGIIIIKDGPRNAINSFVGEMLIFRRYAGGNCFRFPPLFGRKVAIALIF